MSLRPGVLACGLAVALSAPLLLIRPDRLSPEGAVLAVLAASIALWPPLRYMIGRRPAPLPFLAGLGVFYFVCFALSAFTLDLIWPAGGPFRLYFTAPLQSGISTQAMAGLLAGVTLLLGGFVLTNPLFRRNLPALSLGQHQTPSRIVVIAWVLLALHFAYLLEPRLRQIPSLGQIFPPLAYVGFGTLLLLLVRRRIGRLQACLAFGVALPAKIALGFYGSSMAATLLSLVFIGFLLGSVSRRLLLGGTLAMVALVTVGYGPMLSYREIAWDPQLGLAQRIEQLPQILLQGFSPRQDREVTPSGMAVRHQDSTLRRVSREAAKRLNLTVLLSLVIEKTPAEIPYWQGATLAPLVTSFVPRALWPNKPEERAGHSFGWRYELVATKTTDTIRADPFMAVNLPWLVEGYVNFGWPGLVILMGLAGIILSALDSMLNRDGMTELELGLGAALLFPLINHESNVSLVSGSTLPFVVVMLVSLRLALWGMARMGQD
jgi:hypothetical protein